MRASHWESPIFSAWKRDLDLKGLRFANGVLRAELEQESGKNWLIEFSQIQAWKVTTEECAGHILHNLPDQGSLFIIHDSPWPGELGDCSALQGSKHFVICCYDELLEVLAHAAVVHPGQ